MNDEMIKTIEIIITENDFNHNKNIKKKLIIMMKKMLERFEQHLSFDKVL